MQFLQVQSMNASQKKLKEKHHLPVFTTGRFKDKAATRKDLGYKGTKDLRSSKQCGLSGWFSILGHYFPTSAYFAYSLTTC